MKPESAKKLEQKLRREWLAQWLPLIAIVAIGLAGLSLYAWWIKPDPIINEKVMIGRVIHWSQPQSYDTSNYRVISVKLENGKQSKWSPGRAAHQSTTNLQKLASAHTSRAVPATNG